ncbi:MAG TPA: beta/gamma crystallin-related protein [Caulobacteraceae bacterium]|nr:beta/gamma crystallin-related protein [Caulobacteraceae bacterium]
MRAPALALAGALALGAAGVPQIAAAAPDGSYRDSCRDFRVDGPMLSATCPGPGGWRRSALDYKACGGDIANAGGRLVCRRPDYDHDDGWRGPVPQPYDRDDGDWRDRGDRDRSDWGDREDRGDRGGWDRGDGRDGYGGARITFYAQTDFGGRWFGASHPVNDLRDTGFNDRAESVRIEGGVWLLCEDRDFGGRCITLSRSTPDLWRFGMGDKISSFRRIR